MSPLPVPVRILVTWVVILPLALLVQWLLGPLTSGWPPSLRLITTMTIVVPIVVSWALPWAMKLAHALRARQQRRTTRATR